MNQLKQKNLLINCLHSDNIPNLIIYGDKGVGKKHILFEILNDKYSIHQMMETTHYENLILNYKNIYYVVDVSLITNTNNDKIFTYLRSIIDKTNYFKKQLFNIFIFTSFQNVKPMIQNKLRVFIEKYRLTTIFIFVSNKYNSIIEPIRSRCLCIRIPANKKLINNNNNYHIQIYNEYNTYFQKYKDPSKILCEKLFIIYQKNLKEFNFKDIQNIKNISYQLLKSNISIPDFYYQLFDFCIQKSQWTFNIKLKCIQSINDSEYFYHKSYKSIIHIESLLIQIYYLTAAYYEINS